LLIGKLNEKSEPEQIINAFKIVALTIATDKAQATSDKMAKMAKVPAVVKKNNLKYFQEIKGEWDLITEKPTNENNPLFLTDDTDTGKNKITAIISLWQ